MNGNYYTRTTTAKASSYREITYTPLRMILDEAIATASDEELKKAIERAATLLKLGVNPSKSNQNAKIETIQESRDGNLINLPSSDLPAIPSFNSKDIQRLFEMQRVPQDLLRKELDFFTQELNIE